MMKKKTENKFTLLKQLIVLPLLAILVMGLSNREVKTKVIQPEHQLNTSISGNNFPDYNIQSPASSVNENVKNGTDTVIESDQFLISMKLQQNQLILEGLEGCAFTELTFTITNDKPVAINQFGMASVGSGNPADDSGFLFEIEKNYDQIKLIGKTGTAWKELTYKPAIQKHFISETGVSRVNNPLLVVDGVIDNNRSVDDFDPGELKSVSILKDEKAVELYGEKGKNGVIVIQTKSEKDSGSGYSARVDIKSKSRNQVDSKVDVMPEFPGGETALKKFIDNSIVYPKRALEKGIIGTVYIEFVISKSGKVTDAKIARGVDPDLNKEALRVVNTLPLWKPGRKDGKPVDVSYTVPVDFDMKGYPRKVKSVADGLSVPKPLYIVDGQETENMDDISPDDISSIDVLKGESGTKHYGEKGKDGVIVIQTKNYKENSQSELPVVLNGKITQLTLNEVDRDLIQNIKRIEPEEAVKKYGEKAKNGVFEITSRNVYTDKVKVKNSEELKEERITSELELRKFIAKNIKYPVEAQEFGMSGTATVLLKIDKTGKVKIGDQYPDIRLEEVVVVAHSPSEKSSEMPPKDILMKETKRVAKLLKQIDIDNFKGKTVLVIVKFVLQ